ncbi:tetratricopeptide repeat protein [Altibacter lentus]|uniref:tetratricopeptide repeat protein n=1 Tax=Altibacter lentus TaxID=1223410 RepID=UPI0005558377|nr:tetratricopeptide repeat protein [Altibacter lentus]
MKQYGNIWYFFLFGIILVPQFLFAQVIPTETDEQPTDDLGNVSDAFQENFFEALKQKGIENYELALEALAKAEKAAQKDAQNEAVVYFEMGKNLTQLKRYDEAEANFNKVLRSEGDRLDVLEALYDLYYLEQDYQAAIPLVQKLTVYDDDYKEDLANLYARTKQYNKALMVLDELDDTWGESDYRDALRSQIYRETGDTSGQIEKLEEKVIANTRNEKDYLNLIFLYSDQGNSQKAFETAQELLKNKPDSQLVHLALYKFYLDKQQTTEALNSMKIVFKASEIDNESKYRVLSDFLNFVNTNPQYEKDLDAVVALFSSENNAKVYEQLGGYYFSKEMRETALKFYEKGVQGDPDNYNLLKNTLLLQIQFEKHNEAATLSADALEIFPSQPLLYLVSGVSNIALGNLDTAIEKLETGLDYLLDDPKMEKDYYEQLSIAYSQKGDQKKADAFATKAAQVKDTN